MQNNEYYYDANVIIIRGFVHSLYMRFAAQPCSLLSSASGCKTGFECVPSVTPTIQFTTNGTCQPISNACVIYQSPCPPSPWICGTAQSLFMQQSTAQICPLAIIAGLVYPKPANTTCPPKQTNGLCAFTQPPLVCSQDVCCNSLDRQYSDCIAAQACKLVLPCPNPTIVADPTVTRATQAPTVAASTQATPDVLPTKTSTQATPDVLPTKTSIVVTDPTVTRATQAPSTDRTVPASTLPTSASSRTR